MKLLSAMLVFAAFTGVLSCTNVNDTTPIKNMSAFSVRVVTWSVNSNYLPNNLSLIFGMANRSTTPGADMIVIGLQNLGILANENDNDWVKALKDFVHDGCYLPITASIRKGIAFVIFGRTGTYRQIDQSSKKSEGVNLKLLAKDGAIITNFKYFGLQFTFVGLQLNKNMNETTRLKQYQEVKTDTKDVINDSESDFEFWLGNLNFKIDLNETEAKPLIESKNWTALLLHDQLKKAQQDKTAFEDLKEQEITFGPTYKFKPATDKYDWKVTPSWADRILFRSKEDNTITPVKYESIENYKESDHKPVVAEFSLRLNES